jgi:hypothetical protein
MKRRSYMKSKCLKVSIFFLIVGTALLILTGCNGGSSSSSNDPPEPEFEQAAFTDPTNIDNPYLPLNPGTTQLYQVETEDGVETIVVEVLEETKVVAGVTCVVVRDRVFLEELLIEDTHDWYAQDDDGNVWYMGEEVINYEYNDDGNVIGTDNEGAWEAGVDGAIPGIIMKAVLTPGDSYQQEFYEGVAEDMRAWPRIWARSSLLASRSNSRTAAPTITACRPWNGTPWSLAFRSTNIMLRRKALLKKRS